MVFANRAYPVSSVLVTISPNAPEATSFVIMTTVSIVFSLS